MKQSIDVSKVSFFKRYEVLGGKSISDLLLKNPAKVSSAFNQDLKQIEDHNTNFLEELVAAKPPNVQERLKEVGFFTANSYVVTDFNNNSQLERAFQIGSFKSAEIIIEKIFSLAERSQYQTIIMKILPEILAQDQISQNFLHFFCVENSEQQEEDEGQGCRLEMLINDPNAPLFTKEQSSFIKISNLLDFKNFQDEIVGKLLSRQHEEKASVRSKEELGDDSESEKEAESEKDDDQQLFDVTHTFIDFRHMLLGQKLKNLQHGDPPEYRFDDFTLSELIIVASQHSNLLTQPTFKRLIDYQFQFTRPRLKVLFFIYMVFFYVPFIFSFFTDNYVFEIIVSIVGLLTQIFFLGIEVIQMKFKQGDYLKDFWNLADFCQFMIYLVYVILRFIFNFQQEKNFLEIIITLFVIVFGFVKTLFFVRIYEDYGFLVQMVGMTVLELVPFMVFFSFWIIFFTVCFQTLGVQINNDDSEYPNVALFAKYFLMTYRNSIGDISTPHYTNWIERYDAEDFWENLMQDTLISLIWLVWLLNQFLNLIILLNFLIAVISQVYDKVISDQKLLMYQLRAELNKEYFMIMRMYNLLEEYQMLVFTTEKGVEEAEEDEFAGLVQTLKKYIAAQNEQVNHRIDALEDSLTARIRANQEEVLWAIRSQRQQSHPK